MILRDHVMEVGQGEQVVEGKAHYPDLVRLRIPADAAVELATQILTSYQNRRRDEKFLFELPIFGELKVLDEEGRVVPGRS